MKEDTARCGCFAEEIRTSSHFGVTIRANESFAQMRRYVRRHEKKPRLSPEPECGLRTFPLGSFWFMLLFAGVQAIADTAC